MVHLNGVAAPLLRAHGDLDDTPSYGAGGRVYVHVDDHIPWQVAHRVRVTKRRRECFCGALHAMAQLFTLFGLLCGAMAGLLLAWEHQREVCAQDRNPSLIPVEARYNTLGGRLLLKPRRTFLLIIHMSWPWLRI